MVLSGGRTLVHKHIPQVQYRIQALFPREKGMENLIISSFLLFLCYIISLFMHCFSNVIQFPHDITAIKHEKIHMHESKLKKGKKSINQTI